jgi:hypothetical protein
MVSGLFNALGKLPNPAEANSLLQKVNVLAEYLTKLPPERIKSITDLLDKIIELQRQNPGIETLNKAVELVGMINKCDMEKIAEIRQIMKEASKLPLAELIKD